MRFLEGASRWYCKHMRKNLAIKVLGGQLAVFAQGHNSYASIGYHNDINDIISFYPNLFDKCINCHTLLDLCDQFVKFHTLSYIVKLVWHMHQLWYILDMCDICNNCHTFLDMFDKMKNYIFPKVSSYNSLFWHFWKSYLFTIKLSHHFL